MDRSARRRFGRRRPFFDSLKIASLTTASMLGGCEEVDIHVPGWSWDGDFGEVWNTDHHAEATFRQVVPPADRVSLIGVAGSVEIVGRPDAAGIVVEGVRRVRSYSDADAQEHLPDLAVRFREAGGTLFVETRQPAFNHGRAFEVEYRVEVPSGTDLTLVHVSGPIEIRSVSGDVDVQAAAGPVALSDMTANVRAVVASGDVDASVALPRGGLVELQTGSGDIRLSLPAETSASLRAATSSGAVHVIDLALIDQDPRAAVLRAIMADGDGTIRLDTASGDITLQGHQGHGRRT
jgi:hypothetical protein